MKPLFDIKEISNYKSLDKLPFECEECSHTFYVAARQVKTTIKRKLTECRFCSIKCSNHNKQPVEMIYTKCSQCNSELIRCPRQQKQSKSGRSFCSKSCAAQYNNTHKTTGTRRSKLEKWLEEQLIILYPNLGLLFNKKDAINSELDIYIPSLNLAFELNGIFHYEPIYGQDKLNSILNNDNRKFQACLDKNIELVIIDSSTMMHFKPKGAKKYLDIILNIIQQKVLRVGVEPTRYVDVPINFQEKN